MTPLQIAKDHCANWRNDGKGCLGAIIDDDLQIRRCRPKPKCVLGTPGERCAYFEECVAPMGPSIDNEDYRRQFQAAVRDYRLAAKLPCAEERPCPVCGQAMEPGRRFCESCAIARHRRNQRAWVQKRRSDMSKVKAFSALENQGVKEGV